ncbi:MAG: LON peptidase substrate-binding domain-containing protein, partial [bacterium]
MKKTEFMIQQNGEKLIIPRQLPLLPLRDVVVFPYMVTPLLVGRPRSIAAVETAAEDIKYMCVATQVESDVEDPGPDDMFSVGTVIKILQIIRTPDETLKILVEGVARVQITRFDGDDSFLSVKVDPLKDVIEDDQELEALSRSI